MSFGSHRRERRALLIGIGQYDGGYGSIDSAPRDAESLGKVLENHGNFEVDIKFNLDSNTLKEAVKSFLDSLSQLDFGLIYFSGHGTRAGSDFYMCARDTKKSQPQLRSLNGSDFKKWIGESQAGTLVVIADCCFAGALTKGDSKRVMERDLSPIGRSGTYILAATNAYSEVPASLSTGAPETFSLSPYTQLVIDGLNGSADPDNVVISAYGLAIYLEERARRDGLDFQPEHSANRVVGDRILLCTNPKFDFNIVDWKIAQELIDYERPYAQVGALFKISETWRKAVDSKSAENARKLVSEWSKRRYGVNPLVSEAANWLLQEEQLSKECASLRAERRLQDLSQHELDALSRRCFELERSMRTTQSDLADCTTAKNDLHGRFLVLQNERDSEKTSANTLRASLISLQEESNLLRQQLVDQRKKHEKEKNELETSGLIDVDDSLARPDLRVWTHEGRR